MSGQIHMSIASAKVTSLLATSYPRATQESQNWWRKVIACDLWKTIDLIFGTHMAGISIA